MLKCLRRLEHFGTLDVVTVRDGFNVMVLKYWFGGFTV